MLPSAERQRIERRPGGGRRKAGCALAVVPWFAIASADPASLAGQRLTDAIGDLERRGLAVLYSSDLVRPWMRVAAEPTATEPAAILAEIVAPVGLAVRPGPNGMWLLVRARRNPRPPDLQRAGTDPIAVAPLEEVTVTTSRYHLASQPALSVRLEAEQLELLPDLGDDPLRATARLPGAAAQDLSAKANLRGGEVDETLVRFDGLRLFNPFHLKDFQSIFSTIDPAVVRGIDVYTGGFPAAFGDRMSGVISIESLAAANAPQREVALSLYNAAARVADSFDGGRGQWLLSARRSNLDLMLNLADEDRGEPKYTDVYGRVGRELTDSLALTLSALRFDDDIELNDTDFEEEATANYRDAYYWLRLDYEPGPGLRGTVLAARSELDSDRAGRVDQPGISSGELEDRRRFTVDSLQTDWSFARGDALAFAVGAEWRRMDGRYDYRDQAEFDVLFLTPGAPQEPSRERELAVSPSGDQLGAYASLRAQLGPGVVADLGLRWDRETLTAGDAEQLSPRASLLWEPGPRTRLRAAWGRYVQAQAVNELQVSDGVTEFLPPQRADHWVGSVEYAHPSGVELRVEAYEKDYRRLRPRYENLLNAFVLLPELKPDRVRVAPEAARARGLELSVGRRTESPLDWWVTYAWSSVRDEFAGATSRRSWDQTHAFGAGVAWQTEGWELSLAGRYHTGWPTTAIELATLEPFPLIAVGPRSDERLGDYWGVDARIARTFRFNRAGELVVFFEVTNLFNEKNDCCVEFEIVEDEGPAFLDVETVDYLPALPSLGFIWRF